MEERKLNFSAPLLSVRRFSASKTSSNLAKGKKLENSQPNRHQRHSSCNSDVTLDQVTEPAAVPFHWEQIPGIPKDCGMPDRQAPGYASSTRRTEPRRFFDILKQRVEKKSGEKSTQTHHIEANSYSARVAKLDNSKEGLNREKAVHLGNDEDDEYDLYSDALETFSSGDSFSINCSASGLSNLDGLVVESSGTFSTDRQVQDFMMSRFLPAAKAMALNLPHCASKKQPVVVEQPRQIVKVVQPVVVEQSRQIIKVVNVDRRPHSNHTESSLVPVYSRDVENNDSEDEDYEEESNPAQISTKACGLLPRLCIKNSLSILNPVPGLKMRSQASMPPGYESSKPSKITRSRSQSPTTKKHPVIAGSNKKQPDNISKSPRHMEYENKLKFGSNRFTCASDRQPMSRTSSPFRRSACTSPHRSHSPFKDGMGHMRSPQNVEHLKANRVHFANKGGSKSQELVPHLVTTKQWSCPLIPAIEKTLHVDTVKKTQNSHQGSGKDLSSLLKSREVEIKAAAKSLSHNVKCLVVPERNSNTTIKSLVSVEVDSSVDCDKYPPRGQGDKEEDLFQECKALVCIEATIDGNDKNANLLSEEDDMGNIKSSFTQFPAPPPLPKMPSESWLWRTLPSISSRNPFLDRRASFQSKEQDPKPSSEDTKWETIVKSSYMHHDHVRYSEELILHPSQQSRR